MELLRSTLVQISAWTRVLIVWKVERVTDVPEFA